MDAFTLSLRADEFNGAQRRWIDKYLVQLIGNVHSLLLIRNDDGSLATSCDLSTANECDIVRYLDLQISFL